MRVLEVVIDSVNFGVVVSYGFVRRILMMYSVSSFVFVFGCFDSIVSMFIVVMMVVWIMFGFGVISIMNLVRLRRVRYMCVV